MNQSLYAVRSASGGVTMQRELLEHRVVYVEGERVANVLRAGGFAVEPDDVIGKTCREIAWRFGKSARGRKTVAELLESAVDEGA